QSVEAPHPPPPRRPLKSSPVRRRVGCFHGLRVLNSESYPPRSETYVVSIFQFPARSFPKYSPSATWIMSPDSAFSSACHGSRNGFSREPSPPCALALTN